MKKENLIIEQIGYIFQTMLVIPASLTCDAGFMIIWAVEASFVSDAVKSFILQGIDKWSTEIFEYVFVFATLIIVFVYTFFDLYILIKANQAKLPWEYRFKQAFEIYVNRLHLFLIVSWICTLSLSIPLTASSLDINIRNCIFIYSLFSVVVLIFNRKRIFSSNDSIITKAFCYQKVKLVFNEPASYEIFDLVFIDWSPAYDKSQKYRKSSVYYSFRGWMDIILRTMRNGDSTGINDNANVDGIQTVQQSQSIENEELIKLKDKFAIQKKIAQEKLAIKLFTYCHSRGYNTIQLSQILEIIQQANRFTRQEIKAAFRILLYNYSDKNEVNVVLLNRLTKDVIEFYKR